MSWIMTIGSALAKFRRSGLGAVLLFALMVGGGCRNRSQTSDAAAAVEKDPAAIEAAFRDAPIEVRQQATEVATALQSQNDAAAFVRLEKLSGRPDLTPEQRQAAFTSWMAVNARLQQAAANGNEGARDLLEKYRASK